MRHCLLRNYIERSIIEAKLIYTNSKQYDEKDTKIDKEMVI